MVRTVTVVGGGVVGLSCALHLAASGVEVTVVEAAGVGSGASRTNAGWLVPSMCEPVASPAALRVAAAGLARRRGPLTVGFEASPRYAAFLARTLAAATPHRYARGLQALDRLGARALQAFDHLLDAGVRVGRERRGVVRLFLDRQHLAAEAAHLGREAQPLTPGDLRRLLPAVGAEVVGGIWTAGDQHVDPSSLVDALAEACADFCVRVVTGTTVTTVRADDGCRAVVETESGELSSDLVVVAAGVGTRRLLARSGVHVPLRGGKGYGVDFPQPPVDLPVCAYLADHRVALTPLGSGVRVAGTMVFGDESATLDPRRIRAVVSPVGRYLDGWGEAPTAQVAWSGVRPMTPDGLPLIGRLPGHERLVLATGHAMLGVTLGPLTGALVTEIVHGRSSDPALLHPFRPGRFLRGGRRAMVAV